MQATTSGRMASQPSMVAAGAALVIASALLVVAAASQGVHFNDRNPTAPAVPTSPQQVERSLAQVRAGEHEGLQPGWAGAAATGGTRSEIAMTLPADRTPATIGTGHPESADHVGLSEIAAGAIGSGIAPNLPVGNWGLSEIRPNGSTSDAASDSSLSPSSPSYSELVNQRRGEKYRFHKVEAPDAFNRAGASIR